MDSAKAVKSLPIEFQRYNPDIVIFIRDVDGLATELEKFNKVESWFLKLNNAVSKKGILLMNIYELEALILADISTFNSLYETAINFSGDATMLKEPKEFLKSKTFRNKKKFKESHCQEIFGQLNFETLIKRSIYFKKFYNELEQRLK